MWSGGVEGIFPPPLLPSSLASSTRMTSLSRTAGEVCRTLYTVLSRVLQASLWNTMITLVVGRGGHLLNVCSIHLRRQKKRGFGGGAQRCDCALQFLGDASSLRVQGHTPRRPLTPPTLDGVSVSLATAHVWQAACESSPQPEREFN